MRIGPVRLCGASCRAVAVTVQGDIGDVLLDEDFDAPADEAVRFRRLVDE